MQEILSILEDGIQEVFPEVGVIAVTTATELGAIPVWDEASADTFRSFIERRFGMTIPAELLREDTMIGEIAGFIQNTERGRGLSDVDAVPT
ncbi:MAG: hypothetical protein ACOWWM_11320 [Desulfobacterales bacterium]